MADERATRGLWLALSGLAAVPLVLLVVAALPSGARPPVFLLGLAGASALSLWGGLLARGALASGTPRTARAVVAALLGLLVGVTLAMICVWGAVALLAS